MHIDTVQNPINPPKQVETSLKRADGRPIDKVIRYADDCIVRTRVLQEISWEKTGLPTFAGFSTA
jgi:hypothetical protein